MRSLDTQSQASSLTRDDVLSLAEAADLLQLPRSTLADLARRHEVPACKIGRRWIFRRSLLDAATRPSDRRAA